MKTLIGQVRKDLKFTMVNFSESISDILITWSTLPSTKNYSTQVDLLQSQTKRLSDVMEEVKDELNAKRKKHLDVDYQNEPELVLFLFFIFTCIKSLIGFEFANERD